MSCTCCPWAVPPSPSLAGICSSLRLRHSRRQRCHASSDVGVTLTMPGTRSPRRDEKCAPVGWSGQAATNVQPSQSAPACAAGAAIRRRTTSTRPSSHDRSSARSPSRRRSTMRSLARPRTRSAHTTRSGASPAHVARRSTAAFTASWSNGSSVADCWLQRLNCRSSLSPDSPTTVRSTQPPNRMSSRLEYVGSSRPWSA